MINKVLKLFGTFLIIVGMRRITKCLFIATASIGLFSCGNSNSIKAEKVWDTYIDGEEAIEKAYQGVSLKEYEGVTFKLGYTESTDDSVVYINAFSFYIADFNNDGYRDFCLGVSFGSGYIDDRISIYDYHNQVTLYSIDDRFSHNYYFFLRSNRLCIKETNASDDKQVRAGSFYVENGNVLVNWNEELDNVTEYYLKINDRSELIIEMPHLENKKLLKINSFPI